MNKPIDLFLLFFYIPFLKNSLFLQKISKKPCFMSLFFVFFVVFFFPQKALQESIQKKNSKFPQNYSDQDIDIGFIKYIIIWNKLLINYVNIIYNNCYAHKKFVCIFKGNDL